MTSVKSKEAKKTIFNLNREAVKNIATLTGVAVMEQEVFVQLGYGGLTVVKSGTKCGVINGSRMILDRKYESVTILKNGWMVACKYGCYFLYNKEGEMYQGLKFLNKTNAIRFANSL